MMNMPHYLRLPVLLILSFLYSNPIHGADFPTNGLVAYYPFDGDSLDKSGNGNDGVLNGGAKFVGNRSGVSESAAFFDGIDDSFKTPRLWLQSFAVWVKIPKVNKGEHRYLYDGREAGDVINPDRFKQGGYFYSDYETNPGWARVFIDQDESEANWSHMIDHKWAFIYMESPEKVNVISKFMKYHFEDIQFLSGALDDLRIYDRKLTTEEIRALSQEHRPEPETIYVDANYPGDRNQNGTIEEPYKNIMQAITVAQSDDTVLVKPGTYVESVEFNGKSITLTSTDGKETTIIETKNRVLPAVSFNEGESDMALLSGFTIQGGLVGLEITGRAQPIVSDCSVTATGTAIRVSDPGSSPRIENVCVSGADTGIYIFSNLETAPIISNSKIFNCRGRGIWLHRSRLLVSDTVVYNNALGIYNQADGSGVLNMLNCTIVKNDRGLQNNGEGVFANSVFAFNKQYNIFLGDTGRRHLTKIEYSLLDLGRDSIIEDAELEYGQGNISGNPGFVNAELNDFSLRHDSIAIGVGTPSFPEINVEHVAIPEGSMPDLGAIENILSEPKYSIDVQITGGGIHSILKEPFDELHTLNQNVTFTAIPDRGWEFVNWRYDGINDSKNPTEIRVKGSFHLEAVFRRLVSVSRQVSGEGQILVEPDFEFYSAGQRITITAIPDTDSGFIGFSGDVDNLENPLDLTLTKDISLTANFAKLLEIKTNVSEGDGTIIRSPTTDKVLPGTLVTFEAMPNENYGFASWLPESFGDATPLVVPVTEDTEISAVFKPIVRIELQSKGGGSIQLEPEKEKYLQGDTVRVLAEAQTGWVFEKWINTAQAESNPEREITLTEDIVIEASFLKVFRLQTLVNGPGEITTGFETSEYVDGTVVNLSANPSYGYRLSEWGGVSTEDGLSAEVLMDSDKTVSVTFAPVFSLRIQRPEAAGEAIRLLINRDSEVALELQTSSSMIGWVPIYSLQNGQTSEIFQDANSTFLGRRFYRLLPVAPNQ